MTLGNESLHSMTEEKERLREIYDSMKTDALLELHSAGTLTEESYKVLETVLSSRSIPLPQRPASLETIQKTQDPVKRHCAKWAKYFSIVGVVLPIICLALNFEPTIIMRLCELCWPSSFILMVMGTKFELSIVLISIVINVFIWAGFGWLIGYGTSNRIKQ